ncbi:helix-turn-helix domain-containing protein [Alkalihalobacillus oceani]|uniref:helix-turn-helix domain-containing protein n=1 Tax=Halalkalibacter oceani TaxID=1653776 RepID=UPI00203ACDA7|nr:helix-turn-helix domain-containing protein [Halalkalibacter oceani]MCM3763049.1 helix-turn-helix domain-containing protein [Halalkalibacter oceani]
MRKISAEKLGSLIVERRELAGYTQGDLGQKTDINRQIIGRIENKKHIPSIFQLNRLMDVLNFDLSEIAEEKEDRNVFVAMMGEAQTSNEKEWLEDMVSMMLCLRKHNRIRNAIDHAKSVDR